MKTPSPKSEERLGAERVIWICTVRPDSRPHMVPVWFLRHDQKIFICTEPQSVKARNLRANPRVSLALEDGVHPLICEGQARFLSEPWPESVCQGFLEKYEWDIRKEKQYTALLEVIPEKWLTW